MTIGRNIRHYLAIFFYPYKWAVRRYQEAREKVTEADKIYITLTTTPQRIAKLKMTLKSVMLQSHPPFKIFLNIPTFSKRENCPYEIPDFLNAGVTILSPKKDLGPATKLLGTLKYADLNANDKIIVIDDDFCYHYRFVETLHAASAQVPDAVVALQGWRVPGTLLHEDRKRIYAYFITSPTEVDVLQGASGYLVKPQFFDHAVFDYSDAPENVFFADDIWFSGNLAKQHVKKLIVPSGTFPNKIKSWRTINTNSLICHENRNHHNNNVMYAFFKDCWLS